MKIKRTSYSKRLRVVSERDNIHRTLKEINEDEELQDFLQKYAEKTVGLDTFRNFPGLPGQLILYDKIHRFSKREEGQILREVLYIVLPGNNSPKPFMFSHQVLYSDGWWIRHWHDYSVEEEKPGGFYLVFDQDPVYSAPHERIYNGKPITEVEPLKNVKPREILSTLERSLRHI